MILTCCQSAGGHCPTYNRQLIGRVWEILHGVNCTEAEYMTASKSLLAKAVTPVTPPKKRRVKRTGRCNCGKKLKPL